MFQTLVDNNIDILTSTDKEIAIYISNNPKAVVNMTSHELAAILNVAQSSIVRFTKKIGYQGFKHMQYDLESQEGKSDDEEISRNDSTTVTIRKIADQYQDVVNVTRLLNTDESIDKSVHLLHHSKKTIVHGKGNSSLFAEYLSNHLLKMGCDSFSSTNNHTVLSLITNGSNNHFVELIILISESGETKEILDIAKTAQQRKIPVVSLSRTGNTSLSKLSDIVLYTYNDLSGSRLNAMTNRCSQLYLIDILSLNLIKMDYDKYMNNILISETLLDI